MLSRGKVMLYTEMSGMVTRANAEAIVIMAAALEMNNHNSQEHPDQ